MIAWDDFRLIKAIADARGLPGAAARLGINHSTVFRRLAQIEDGLGATLFDRRRGGYVPTPAGEEMIGLAQRLDDDITAFTLRLAGREWLPAGELRVTMSDSLLVHLLTPLLARFRDRYPDIRLDLIIGNQALNLSKRDADVAIRASDNPPENLVGRRVARIAWALYGRAADFPDPAAAAGTLDDRAWVGLGDGFGGMKVVRALQARVAPERVVYKLNTVLGLAEAVEAGIGIGHLPCLIGDARPGLARLGPPEPDYAADLWLLTHPDLRHQARVRAFFDFIAAEIAGERGRIEGLSVTPAAS